MTTKFMLSVFPEERLRPRLLRVQRTTPTATHSDGHSYSYGHRDCDANESDGNCHCHRFRQSDTNTQTNAHSETTYDTEAAPESAAKAERSEPMIR